MSGIFGCVGKLDRSKAEECVDKIRHRGRDAVCLQELEGATLAQMKHYFTGGQEDLVRSMHSSDKRYWMIWDGEVYNIDEIKEELQIQGFMFETKYDTEVLLNAYICWGEEFQEKCNGKWVIAIWDSYEKELFLSRDRFGIKSLYWYQDENNLYFASELKAFFPVMKERRPNYELFNPYRTFVYGGTEKCAIQDIKRFLAGHCAKYKNGKVTKHRWWNTLEHLMEVPMDYEEQVEYFRSLFLDSVRLRMRSDIPIGATLSGGVDSPAIVGVMAYLKRQKNGGALCHDWENIFVSSLIGTTIDETELARKSAECIGVKLNEIDGSTSVTAEKLMYSVYMAEEPYQTALLPHFNMYKGIAERGIKVTLDGVGADVLFGAYFDLMDVIQYGNHSDAELEEIVETYNMGAIPGSYMSMSDARKMQHTKKFNEKKYNSIQWQGLDTLNKVLYADIQNGVLPQVFRTADIYGMSSGVESRMPFMDYRIVNFAFSIDKKAKMRNGYMKAIIRDMARPFLNDEIVSRKIKYGLNDPFTEWFRGPLKEFVLDSIHSTDFYECELINSLEVFSLINEFYKGSNNSFASGHSLWVKMLPYFWKKAVIDLE